MSKSEDFDFEETIVDIAKRKANVSKSAFVVFITLGLLVFLAIGFFAGYMVRSSRNEGKVVYYNVTSPSKTPLSTTTMMVTSDGKKTTTKESTTQRRPIDSGIWDNIRLPGHFIPTYYNLIVRTFLPAINTESSKDKYKGFKGDIEIFFNLTANTDEILFHANQTLKIFDPIQIINTVTQNRTTIRDETHTHKIKNQYFYIKLKKPLPIGSYCIKMSFDGETPSLFGNTGIFAVSYSEDSMEKNLIATRFGTTDARKVFPCFDEPHLKAKFKITIESPLGTKAISNFPVRNVSYENGSFADRKTITEFEETFIMSTYLVGWAIVPEDFANISIKSEKGIQIQVYARKSVIKNAEFALQTAKEALEFYENYLEISKAIPPKIDLIAIPDYPARSAEQWGIIGFRERELLFSEQHNSVREKQKIALTICHQLVHFWFGNLVTFKWWNELWLSEGFATFLQYKAIESMFPEWNIRDQSIIEDTLPSMFDDGFASSHPIIADVSTPNEVNSIFDTITYSKAGSILKMLEEIVGKTEFQKGLRIYLKANEFGIGNAETFFNSLELPDDMKYETTVTNFMNTWLRQANYPQVSVKLEQKTTKRSTIVYFTQSRFLLTGYKINEDPLYVSPYNFTWEIYLQCKAGVESSDDELKNSIGSESFTYFLKEKNGRIELYNQFKWVKCNLNFMSFYVADYSTDIFTALAQVLTNRPSVFSTADRADLIHVSYQLAFLGIKDYRVPAMLSSYLESELEYIPWKVFTYHISKIALLLQRQCGYDNLARFGVKITRRVLQEYDLWSPQVKSDKSEHLETLLKMTILEFLCQLEDRECLRNAIEKYNEIKQYFNSNSNPNLIELPPHIRSVVYQYYIQNTYQYDDWFELYGIYGSSMNPIEQSYVLVALSYSRSTWILSSYLERVRMGKTLKRQDFFFILNAISQNPSGRDLIWFFIRQHWEEIIDRFGFDNQELIASLKLICATFENQYVYNEMISFFESYLNVTVSKFTRQLLVQLVGNNVVWVTDRANDVYNNLARAL